MFSSGFISLARLDYHYELDDYNPYQLSTFGAETIKIPWLIIISALRLQFGATLSTVVGHAQL